MIRKLLFLGILALLYSKVSAVAPHPTLVTAQYKDMLLPVIKVKKLTPIVIVKGKEKKLKFNRFYIPQRTDGFSDGYIEIHSMKNAIRHGANRSSGTSHGGVVYFDAVITSQRTMSGGYALLAASNVKSRADDATFINTSFIARELPKLTAGQETTFSFAANLENADTSPMDFFVQFFDSNGREILTNKVEKAWKYYALLEKVQHHEALEKYLLMSVGKDLQAFPVVHPKPVFPEGTVVPEDATAIMTISPEGYADGVITRGLSDALNEAAIQALEGWLFMPQLKAGKPVASRVQVPIVF